MARSNVRVENVPDPKILNPRDAIVKITSHRDLRLRPAPLRRLHPDDEAAATSSATSSWARSSRSAATSRTCKVGDRVVVPFPIACGHCFFCQRELYSLCDNSNPNAWMAEKLWGYSPCGIFGYSHMLGGYAGGQAEYARVPFADVGPIKVPDDLDRRAGAVPVRHLPDRLHGGGELQHPAGRHGRGLGLRPGRAVRDQERVPARRRAGDRASTASRTGCAWRASAAGAETINYEEVDVLEALKEMTGGRGPDPCIDAVGLEAHGHGLLGAYDRVKTAMMLETDRPIALRQAILACRKGGTVSIPGVYGGFIDKFPMGAVVKRSLTIKIGPDARAPLHAAAARAHRATARSIRAS